VKGNPVNSLSDVFVPSVEICSEEIIISDEDCPEKFEGPLNSDGVRVVEFSSARGVDRPLTKVPSTIVVGTAAVVVRSALDEGPWMLTLRNAWKVENSALYGGW
jgi:hypothetical protein